MNTWQHKNGRNSPPQGNQWGSWRGWCWDQALRKVESSSCQECLQGITITIGREVKPKPRKPTQDPQTNRWVRPSSSHQNHDLGRHQAGQDKQHNISTSGPDCWTSSYNLKHPARGYALHLPASPTHALTKSLILPYSHQHSYSSCQESGSSRLREMLKAMFNVKMRHEKLCLIQQGRN